MSRWRLCGHDGTGGRALALDGGRIMDEARADSADAALAALDAPGPVLRVGEGVAAALPAALLPDPIGNGLPGLVQETPPDCLDAWVRLLLIGLGDHDGIACVTLPGLAHWIHLSAGEAVSCQSFLTPRIAAALGAAAEADPTAIADTMSRPERLAAHLRAAEVQGAPAALTGHLLGAELAAARPYWLGQHVALIGDDKLCKAYSDALGAQGLPVERTDAERMTLEGLKTAYARLKESAQ